MSCFLVFPFAYRLICGGRQRCRDETDEENLDHPASLNTLLAVVFAFFGTALTAVCVHKFKPLRVVGPIARIAKQCTLKTSPEDCILNQLMLRTFCAITMFQLTLMVLFIVSEPMGHWLEQWFSGSIASIAAFWGLLMDLPNQFFDALSMCVWGVAAPVMVFQSALVVDAAHRLYDILKPSNERDKGTLCTFVMRYFGVVFISVSSFFVASALLLWIHNMVAFTRWGGGAVLFTGLFGIVNTLLSLYCVTPSATASAGSLLASSFVLLDASATVVFAFCDASPSLSVLRPIRLWMGCVLWLLTAWRSAVVLRSDSSGSSVGDATVRKDTEHYHPSWWNVTLIGYAAQLTLVVLDWRHVPSEAWGLLSSRPSPSTTQFNAVSSSFLPTSCVVLLVTRCCATLLLYTWTLVAPFLLPDRVF